MLPPRAQTPGSMRLAARTILIVDDHRELTDMLADGLEAEGAKVVVAHDAESALALVEAHTIDALVVDLHMPRLTGFDFIRKVRTSRGRDKAALPAIAITGAPDWQYQDPFEAVRAGFDFHLAKPVMPQELARQLSALLRQRSRASKR